MSTVSIVRVHQSRVTEAVRRAVGLVHGLSVIKPGDTVLIKPNLVKPSLSGSGIITDARVTEAVVELVLEHGPRRVTIGEGSSVGYDFPGQVDSLAAMEVSGTAEVARKFGLQMIDLNHVTRSCKSKHGTRTSCTPSASPGQLLKRMSSSTSP